MNSVIYWIRSNVVKISAFFRTLMFLGLGMEWFELTEAQEGLWLAAISGFFDLWTSKETIAANKVDDIVDKGMERAAKVDMNKEN